MNTRDLRVQAVQCYNLKAASRDEALRELVWSCFNKGSIKSPEDVFSRLLAREALASTSLGDGFAIPHARLPYIDHVLLAIGRSGKGISYSQTNPRTVHLIFMMLSPEGQDKNHLQMLARVARLLKDNTFTSKLIAASTQKDFSSILETYNIEVL